MSDKKEHSPICIACGQNITYGLSNYCRSCLREEYGPDTDDFETYNRNEREDYEDED